jgi:hypothetical protein
MSKGLNRFVICFLFSITGLLPVLANEGVSVFIRFYDKKIYYLGRTEDIKIKVSIVNKSIEPFRFKVADDRIFNLDFEVKTPGNIALDHSKEFTIQRNSFQYVYFKEVELEPEEEYGYIVQLDRYIHFDRPGVFTVQAQFHPDLMRDNRGVPMKSNLITLNIRPKIERQELKDLVEVETGEFVEKEVLPPDEVVEFTIRARQRSQWTRFFLYLDVRSLLLNNPEYRVKYEKLPEEGRKNLEQEYREKLKEELVNRDILVIPTEFEIQRTSYTPFEAEVKVLEKFKYPDFTERKLYTYHLIRKQDKYWEIANYEVLNLPTE